MLHRLPALRRGITDRDAPVAVSRRSRFAAGLVAALTVAATVLAAFLTSSSPASAATGCAMRGTAYASSVRGGGNARSQHSANLALCTARVGVSRHNRTGSATEPKALLFGSVTSRLVTRQKTPGPAHRITAQTHTDRVVLLGQIHARAIVARATASTRRDRARQLVGRTTIDGLTLQGKNVPEHPKRDQTYSLPGLGTMVLNHQTRVRHGDRISITVTALQLFMGKNNPLGQKPGVITIGHTVASVRLPNKH